MKKNYLLAFSALFILLLGSCSGEKQKTSNQDIAEAIPTKVKGQNAVVDDVSAKNILQIAMGSPDHTTLVAAVQAAGIEHILANNGPLTVFAPTNSAFEKLPEGTVENLLKPENKQALARILTYHAAPGTYKGVLLKDGMSLFQATGDNVKIERNGDEITVNGAKILATIVATNGVVHVIDAVLLPPEEQQ